MIKSSEDDSDLEMDGILGPEDDVIDECRAVDGKWRNSAKQSILKYIFKKKNCMKITCY